MASLTAIRNFKARYNRIQPKIKVKKHPVWSICIVFIGEISVTNDRKRPSGDQEGFSM